MKDQIMMILFVVILGIVASAILVGSDSYTKDIIQNNQEYALKSTILNAFEIEATEDEVLTTFDRDIEVDTIDDQIFYKTSDGSVGFEIAGKGLWGPIEGFLTLESDLVTIKGIQIIYNEETPGLGGVIAEQWYLDKFKGKQFDPEVLLLKNADPASNTEVDSITGATMTSNFFQILLNADYQERKGLLE